MHKRHFFCDIIFSETQSGPLTLDLYMPAEPSGREFPLICWFFGGAWRNNDKSHCRAAMMLLEHGYAVASIQYRLSHQALFPAQIIDCKAAIRFLRAHANRFDIDPDRIACFGQSSGGHLAALVGTSGKKSEWERGDHPDISSSVKAVCDWFGPTDFLQMNKKYSEIDHDAAESPESCLIGGPIQQHKGRAREANPVTYIHADTPPFLIMHGDKDVRVPLNQSQILHDALIGKNLQSTFLVITGAGHGFDRNDPAISTPVLDFFSKHLCTRTDLSRSHGL